MPNAGGHDEHITGTLMKDERRWPGRRCLALRPKRPALFALKEGNPEMRGDRHRRCAARPCAAAADPHETRQELALDLLAEVDGRQASERAKGEVFADPF